MTILSRYLGSRPKLTIALVVMFLALLVLATYWRIERAWVHEVLGFKAFLGPPFFEADSTDLEGDGYSFRQYELTPRLIEAFEQRTHGPDSFPSVLSDSWRCNRWSPTPLDRAAEPAILFVAWDLPQEANVRQRLREPGSWYAYCVKNEIAMDGAEVFLLDTKYRVLTHAYAAY